MINRSWDHVEVVMRDNLNLPFPSAYYMAEAVGGLDNDALYISDQLRRLTMAQRSRAVAAYEEVYTEHGRYSANTRLREFADRCEKANKGVVKRFGD